jgi:vacuolar protein sorting-associated protein 35
MRLQLYVLTKKQVQHGGSSRLQYTIPALTFGCLRLVSRVFEREQREDPEQLTKTKPIFKMVHQFISSIVMTSPRIAVRMFLAAAIAADRCGFEEITYEFMTQAFVTYEEEIANSKEQQLCVQVFASTVQVR